MITPKITGAIITGIIIVLGVALLYPALRLDTKLGTDNTIKSDKVILLTFNIINSSNMPSWCYDLSRFLQDNKIHSTVFIPGVLADAYPSCISSFGTNIDIGSMSYTYEKLTSISAYPDQLSQVMNGKRAIDQKGGINSTLYRAPYGIVDQNIYSLLARSHIIADFSYADHYNIYTDGLSGKTFYRFPITTLPNLKNIQSSSPDTPWMVNFYNYDPIINIQNLINSTSESYRFISTSELTNLELTSR